VEIWEKRRDLYASADLWRECLGRRWPLDPATLSALLDRPGYGKHFVVRHLTSGELLGLCVTYVIEDSTGRGGHDGNNKVVGSLAALLVRPTHRDLGIGLSLHNCVLRHLRNIPGISSLQLGSIFPRFFPGIPADLPAEDINWFSHRGWKLDGRPTGMVYDLYMSLDLPSPPSPHPAPPGITISPCRPEQFPSLITFIQQHFGSFPGWVEKYSSLRDTDDIADAILARRADAGGDGSGAVVAAAVIYTPVGNSQISKDIPWARTLGERVGGIGLVGVKSSDGSGVEGEDGIMRALLVAKAVEELRMRGCRGVFVDWVDEREVSGYAGVGFLIWGKYREIWSKV